jgi:hypothetical protein
MCGVDTVIVIVTVKCISILAIHLGSLHLCRILQLTSLAVLLTVSLSSADSFTVNR